MAASVSPNTISAAIDAGVDYLARAQLPSGEFQTFVGPRPDLVDSIVFTTSPYITTYVAHALSHLPDSGALTKIRQRVGDFLESEEEPDGSWNFQGRETWRIPADVDTTSCAAAALLVLNRREPRSFYPLLLQVIRSTEAGPGGPYYTYIGVNQRPDIAVFKPLMRELDVLVNVSVVFFCGLLGIEVPGATGFLVQGLQREDFAAQNRYYISSHFEAYTVSRAIADAGVKALVPAVPTLLRRLDAGRADPSQEGSAFHLSCMATSLITLGQPDEVVVPYLGALLRMQETDGGWPIWAAGAGFPREWDWSWLERWPEGPGDVDRGWCWGSRAMTTALALESLARWVRRVDSSTDVLRPGR